MQVGVLFGNPETTSGGNALKYYASMRLDIRGKEKIVEAGKPEPVGNKVKVKVVKNKVSGGRCCSTRRRQRTVCWLCGGRWRV
jgi:recombination protein RecA